MNEAYKKFVESRSPSYYHSQIGHAFPAQPRDHILHAILGVTGEAGEIIDAYKKSFAYGKELDLVNLDEEFGDLLWFIQLYCNARGISYADLISMNTAKLELRYPNGFTYQEALNRDLEQERNSLEASHESQTN